MGNLYLRIKGEEEALAIVDAWADLRGISGAEAKDLGLTKIQVEALDRYFDRRDAKDTSQLKEVGIKAPIRRAFVKGYHAEALRDRLEYIQQGSFHFEDAYETLAEDYFDDDAKGNKQLAWNYFENLRGRNFDAVVQKLTDKIRETDDGPIPHECLLLMADFHSFGDIADVAGGLVQDKETRDDGLFILRNLVFKKLPHNDAMRWGLQLSAAMPNMLQDDFTEKDRRALFDMYLQVHGPFTADDTVPEPFQNFFKSALTANNRLTQQALIYAAHMDIENTDFYKDELKSIMDEGFTSGRLSLELYETQKDRADFRHGR